MQFIKKRKKENNLLTDIEASQILKGILKGIQYIHEKNIVHRDLKPENIIFGAEDDLESIKIVDFGLSKQFSKDLDRDYLREKVGTMIYMAPELINHQSYS